MGPSLNGKSNKDKGNVGIGVAMAYFTSIGSPISIPMNDTQPYDLVVDLEGKLNRVQVKTSTFTEPSGNYTVSLRTTGGNRSFNTAKSFDSSTCDLLFAYCANGDMYLIPSEDITSINSITLGGLYTEYKVTFC